MVANPKNYGPWICDSCKAPIEDGEGVVEVVNLDGELGPVGSYPMRATPESEEIYRDASIGVRAYHIGDKGCDPYPGQDGYHIAVERAPTLGSWCQWMDHLFEKTWMGRSDLQRFLNYWWDNRSADIHREPH